MRPCEQQLLALQEQAGGDVVLGDMQRPSSTVHAVQSVVGSQAHPTPQDDDGDDVVCLACRTLCSSGTAASRKDELKLEDLLYAVRRDPRKVARIQVSHFLAVRGYVCACVHLADAVEEEGVRQSGVVCSTNCL